MPAPKKKDDLHDSDNPSSAYGRRLAMFLLSYVHDLENLDLVGSNLLSFEHEISQLAEILDCASCGKQISVDVSQVIYCSECCQQIAGTVRYVRRARTNGRESNTEFQTGLGDRLNHLPSGGYPARDRRLQKDVREMIFKRDGQMCRICRLKLAKQIDHIKGSSSSFSNLQAVCADCNREKAFSSSKLATSKERKRIENLYMNIAMRVAARLPLKACDDDDRWRSAVPKLRAARKRFMVESRNFVGNKHDIDDGDEAGWEDTDGYVAHTMRKDN